MSANAAPEISATAITEPNLDTTQNVFAGQYYVVLDFQLSRSSGADTIDTLIVQNVGSTNANTEAIGVLHLYRDGGEGQFIPSSDCQASTATFTGGIGGDTWTFDDFVSGCDTIPVNPTQRYFLVLRVSGTATQGDTVQFVIPVGGITSTTTADTGPAFLATNDPNNDYQTLRQMGSLTFTQSSDTTTVIASKLDQLLLTLTFSAAGEPFSADTIPLIFYGTNNNDTHNVDRVKVYRDANGDTVFNASSDTQIADTVTWSPGINGWIVRFDGGETISSAGTTIWYVAVDVPATATIGDTIGVYADTITARGVNSGGTLNVVGAPPTVSNWHYIIEVPPDLRVSAASTSFNITRGQNNVGSDTQSKAVSFTISDNDLADTNAAAIIHTIGIEVRDTAGQLAADSGTIKIALNDSGFILTTYINYTNTGQVVVDLDAWATAVGTDTAEALRTIENGENQTVYLQFDLADTAAPGYMNIKLTIQGNTTPLTLASGPADTWPTDENTGDTVIKTTLTYWLTGPNSPKVEKKANIDVVGGIIVTGDNGVAGVVKPGDENCSITFVLGNNPGDTQTADAQITGTNIRFVWDTDENCVLNTGAGDIDLSDTLCWEFKSANYPVTMTSGETFSVTAVYRLLEHCELLTHREILRPEITFRDMDMNDTTLGGCPRMDYLSNGYS